jgi:fatty acid desaturase
VTKPRTEADPYFQFEKLPNWIRYTIWFPRGLLLFPVWTLRAFVGTVASFVPSIIPFYARAFLQDRQARVATAEMLHCAKAERPLTLFLMILAGFAIRFPGEIIYGYFIPVLLSGIFFGLRLMLEHSGGDGAPVDREIRGPMGTILYPRNSGYHRTHHLHPKVSFRDLPNMADKIH